jgi:hypothetical protein
MNRDDASKFQVGDRVYAPFHGYGTVIEVHEHPSVYPVVVKWDNSTTSLAEEVSLFTEDGYLSRWTKTDDTRIRLANERETIMDYQKIARGIVLNYVNKHLDKTDNVHITSDDVYLVWFCKVLQNWKALVSTNLPDGMYYEVTYNGDKKEVYLDAYKKFDNRKIDESQI